jgi:uncharacterized membrane protein YkvA (DUF1232 family)
MVEHAGMQACRPESLGSAEAEITGYNLRFPSADGDFAMIRLLRLWRLGRQDVRLLWFALRHRSRPMWLWPAAALLALYALDPANFAIPVLGVVDDLVLLPLLLHLVVKLLPAEIRAAFRQKSLVS